jgi:hypothetical protein
VAESSLELLPQTRYINWLIIATAATYLSEKQWILPMPNLQRIAVR